MDLSRYPRTVTCRHQMAVTINLLTVDQIDAQVDFLRSLPERDRGRLPHDVLDPNYPKKLRRQIEDGLAYRLVAWHEEKIVGSLSLYRGSSRWINHTGSVVVITRPEVRRSGVATVLFDELIPLAESLQIEKLYANMIDEHKEAAKMFQAIGFKKEATLRDHIKDTYGRLRALKIYSIDLEAAHRAMEDLILQYTGSAD